MSTAKLAKVVALTGAVVVAAGVILGLSLSAALGQPPGPAPSAAGQQAQPPKGEQVQAQTTEVLAAAIAVVISISCLAAGYAVGKVGSAAMGAASEKPELMGRALLFVALAEGIAIYGVLAAILLYTKIPA